MVGEGDENRAAVFNRELLNEERSSRRQTGRRLSWPAASLLHLIALEGRAAAMNLWRILFPVRSFDP